MESSDDFELTRVNMTPDSNNRDGEPIDRAVAGNGMSQSLPSIQPFSARRLSGGRYPFLDQPGQPMRHGGCRADAVEVTSVSGPLHAPQPPGPGATRRSACAPHP